MFSLKCPRIFGLVLDISAKMTRGGPQLPAVRLDEPDHWSGAEFFFYSKFTNFETFTWTVIYFGRKYLRRIVIFKFVCFTWGKGKPPHGRLGLGLLGTPSRNMVLWLLKYFSKNNFMQRQIFVVITLFVCNGS